MANQLPCPNPMCSHVFPAQEVQNAELLKCPRCGQQFRFRPPGSAPPSKAAPAAKNTPASKPAASKQAPVAKPAPPIAATKPTAPPVAVPAPVARPAVPVAVPVAPVAKPVAPPAADPFEASTLNLPPPPPEPGPAPFADQEAPPSVEDHGPLVRSRGVVKNKWTAKHYVVLSIGLLTIAGLVTTVLVLWRMGIISFGDYRGLFARNREDNGSRGRIFNVRNLQNKEERAFQLAVPQHWSADKELRTRLEAVTAWSSKESDAWFAVAVEDFGQQRPRDGQMVKSAIERLERHFGDALELARNPLKATLAGEDCQALPFKGTINSVTWYGECYLLAYQGFAYSFFVAASVPWGKPQDARQIKEELEKNKSFTLVTDRRGWHEEPPKMDTFHAQSAPLSITVPSGAWEKAAARDEEETGELFLFGRYLREKDNRKNASILIFTTEKRANLKESLREARAYLEKRKQEENPKYKFAAAQEGASELGEDEAVGDQPGRVAELKLLFNDEPKRYFLLAVVHHDEKAYVLRCDCAWEHRQIWHQDFRNALATLKFATKE